MPHLKRPITKIAVIGTLCLCVLGLTLFVRNREPIAFTIDMKERRQTIEGFGATATGVWIPEIVGLYTQPTFAQQIGGDLGVSIIRLALPPAIQPNEDLDPSQLNLDSFDFSQFSPPANFIQRIHQAHPELKVILSVWSPPAWMKTNNSTINGGHLREDRRTHFAKFCAAACIGFERDYGVPVYGLSVQNEPAFAQTYDSCVYAPEQLRDTVIAVRAAFTRWNVQTKIMAPEDVADPKRYAKYIKPFAQDPAALQALDIMNVHGAPWDSTSETSGPWKSLLNQHIPLNKPMWMSETSGEEPTWLGEGNGGRGGLYLAKSIHNALVFGQCAAWVYWAIADPSPSEFALMGGNEPTPKYFALRQYSRYISPGALRIAVTPMSPTILASAYLDEGRGKLTVVFINLNPTDKTITASLASSPRSVTSFQTVRSSTDESCVSLAETPVVGGLLSLTLRKQSVTTLIGNSAPYPTTRTHTPQ